MERKFSSLDDLDEDFLMLHQRSSRLQGRGAIRMRSQRSQDPSSDTEQTSPAQKSLSTSSWSLAQSVSSRSTLGELVVKLRADSFGASTMGRIPENRALSIENPSEPLKPFLEAINNDDGVLFKDLHKNLINGGSDFSNKTLHLEDGRNILHLAIQRESDIVEYLLETCIPKLLTETFISPLGSAMYKSNALHLIVEQDNVELTTLFLAKLSHIPFWKQYEFLKSLTTVHVGDNRVQLLSVLHIAAMKGNIQILKLLVKYGASVDTVNESKETPLMWAIWANRLATVKALVQLGASPNHEDDKGSTPLYWATRYGYADVVNFLLGQCGVNVNHRRKFGYVLPLVLASAMGHANIVHDLLRNGASVNATVSGGKTALHHAAAHGHEDILKTLLHFGAKINMSDESGNTPLIYATKEGKLHAIQKLLENGADMHVKNKMGQSVWDFIIEHQDNTLLEMYVKMYKLINSIKTDTTFTFEKGRTPIHIAALKNNASKVRCLLDLHLDWKCSDDMGNTFLHTAARENSTLVLDEFANELDTCVQNDHGDTPLHIAVKQGHVESVRILMSRASLGTRNITGTTPLHTAAWSDHGSSDVVRLLVETIVACNNWSLLDAVDSKGNTALHIAAKKARTDIIEELHTLDTKITNNEGNNPLHVAALSGGSMALEAMLDIFKETANEEFPDSNFQRVCLDQANGSGDTLLHICARQGDFENVKSLIEEGANLAARNHLGNTVLHDLVEQAVHTPSKKESYIQVYNVIVSLSSIWWCKRKGHHIPDDDSNLIMQFQRTAMLHLTSDICNYDGRSVLTHCVAVGATPMLEAILNTPNIYRFVGEYEYSFDITNLTPDTETESSKTLDQIVRQRAVSICAVEPLRRKDLNQDISHGNESCLDIIIGLGNEVQATKMLDVAPIRQLVRNYWTAYQLVYGFFMISHIIFMSFFTNFGITTITYSSNSNTSLGVHVQSHSIESEPLVFPPILLLMWPIGIIVFEIYYLVTRKRRNRSRRKSEEKDFKLCAKGFYKECFGIPYAILSHVLDLASHLAGIFFSVSVFAWFFCYEFRSSSQAYVLSVALMFGWMFTISFAKGFETVHSFSIILKHIFVRDITRFIFIYCFVMFGFSLAFHVLFQLVPSFAQRYHSPWDTFFMTLNVMLGLEDSLFEDFESSYITAVAFIKVVYVLYVLLSSIILLNLLIAMMTDTYSNIISREGTTWRLGSVRLALKIERSFPFLKTIFKKIGIIHNTITFDSENQRWMMTIPKTDMVERQSDDKSESSTANSRMETRLAELQTTCQGLTRQMDNLMKIVELMNENSNTEHLEKSPRRFKSFRSRRSSLQTAVQRWREKVQFQRHLSSESNAQSPIASPSPHVTKKDTDAEFYFYNESPTTTGAASDNQKAAEAATPLTQSLQAFVKRWRDTSNNQGPRRRSSSSRGAEVRGQDALEEEEGEGEGGGYVNPAFRGDSDIEGSVHTRI